jgi:hypothetical protein
VTDDAPKQSAAETAAEKVRAIVEAAERSSAELEAAARQEAGRIRAEAEREVESLVGRARVVAARVAERAGELDRQVAAIRTSLDSLRKDLEELRTKPAGSTAPPTDSGAAAAARESRPVASVPSAEPPGDLDETIAEAQATSAREPEIAAPEGSGEGARLIALNMALSGTPREDTARYLAENFDLDDPDALLDDVYARARG